jgi:hypothetical protein
MRIRIAASVLLVLVSLALLPGCKNLKPVGSDEPEVPDFNAEEYPDAIRLSNGSASLIIVPSIGGRIMRYGLVGGPNVLWNNPKARRLADPGAPPSTQPDAYVNYGGDKAWPWPQDQWPLLMGRTYPPPAEADQVPFKSRLVGSHGVRLESPPIRSHGCRIVREITLDPVGTRVTIVTRLELATYDRPPPELAAWSVTQVPGDAKLYARVLPDGVVRPMRPGGGPPTTRPVAGRVFAIEPPVPGTSKLGLDGDILAAALGKTLYIQHSSTAAAANVAGYRRGERAQVFTQQADPPKRDVPRYVELEFTSPRRDLAASATPELRVTWQLVESPQPWSDKSVGAYLQGDLPAEPANPRLPGGVP